MWDLPSKCFNSLHVPSFTIYCIEVAGLSSLESRVKGKIKKLTKTKSPPCHSPQMTAWSVTSGQPPPPREQRENIAIYKFYKSFLHSSHQLMHSVQVSIALGNQQFLLLLHRLLWEWQSVAFDLLSSGNFNWRHFEIEKLSPPLLWPNDRTDWVNLSPPPHRSSWVWPSFYVFISR